MVAPVGFEPTCPGQGGNFQSYCVYQFRHEAT